MPPRINLRAKPTTLRLYCQQQRHDHQQYATATITTPHGHVATSPPPIARYPSTQPPSYKPPEFRKSQLLRQYASLLRSTPLMLLFQHNNLKSAEWVGLRRELAKALAKVSEAGRAAGGSLEPLEDGIKIQIIQTGIFAAALRIVEFYKPVSGSSVEASDLALSSGSAEVQLTHTLSKTAHEAVVETRSASALAPLLSGPLMLVTFPNVAPQYLRAVLSTLSPSAPEFPSPTRKANPGWYDPAVQNGIQKLLLLGARVEGKVFDIEGTKWVGGIEGGLDGLRSQLVAILQSVGGGLTNTLESAGKNLYFTVEGRRMMLEDEGSEMSGEAQGGRKEE